MNFSGLLGWLFWGGGSDLLLGIAFFYLAIAVHKLRCWYPDDKQPARIEDRANVVILLAIIFLLLRWTARPPLP